jgi:hypothetical protein
MRPKLKNLCNVPAAGLKTKMNADDFLKIFLDTGKKLV